MSVYFAIPSARPIDEARPCFDAWKSIGCKVAATRKDPTDHRKLGLDLGLSLPVYQGWPTHVNLLAKAVLECDPTCNIVVSGGDDCWPDPDWPAERVEAEFIEHFGGTLGVMQPVGDVPGTVPWSKAVIDGLRVQWRIAWAPWMGREWCQRAYGGRGPMWGEYFHMFADADLQVVAKKLGLFHQRPDIHQDHRTWKQNGTRKEQRPEHLIKANELWDRDKGIYFAREAADFPGHELA